MTNPTAGEPTIVLDLHWFDPTISGGIQSIAKSLVRAIAKSKRHFVIVGRRRTISYFEQQGTFPENVRFYDLASKHSLARKLVTKIMLLLQGDFQKGSSTALIEKGLEVSGNVVVVSIPGYISELFIKFRNVLIVPDIQHEFTPENFSKTELAWRQKHYSRSIAAADRVVAISEYTRKTILEKYAGAENKVSVIPLAASSIFNLADYDDGKVTNILSQYNLEKNEYLFFPANTWAHKNHLGLLDALAALNKTGGIQPQLILTGTKKANHAGFVNKLNTLGLERQVRHLGNVPADDLAGLYAGARMLVFPSKFEGFGLPLLEAMRMGCPIVCSNTTSLPEVGQDSVIYFDPAEPQDMAEKIDLLWANERLRDTLREKGFERAKQYNTAKFFSELLKEIDQLNDNT